jgi:hypothetical protein
MDMDGVERLATQPRSIQTGVALVGALGLERHSGDGDADQARFVAAY